MFMCNWSSLLSVFIFSNVAVFVIVVGQSTTGDNCVQDDQLINTVTNLQAELAKLAAKTRKLVDANARIEAELAKSVDKMAKLEAGASNNGTGGVTYIRWGRRSCENNGATLLYNGYAAGRHIQQGGGGSNILCLPAEPQWKNHTDTTPSSGWLYGIEYRVHAAHATFFSGANNAGSADFHLKPAPCAVCYVPQRSAHVMIAARTECPAGWTREYDGYLMSEHSFPFITGVRHSTSYICVDGAPEVGSGSVDGVQAMVIMVKVGCGTLPCSKYINGWELACIVCTK